MPCPDCEPLKHRAEHAEARVRELEQAVGLVSTCVPEMVIDSLRPLKMVHTIVARFQDLNAKLEIKQAKILELEESVQDLLEKYAAQ